MVIHLIERTCEQIDQEEHKGHEEESVIYIYIYIFSMFLDTV